MTCCLNPDCHKPINSDNSKFCQSCGTPLKLLQNRYRSLQILDTDLKIKTYLVEDTQDNNRLYVVEQFYSQQKTQEFDLAELLDREARKLQKLGNNTSIVKYFDYFEQDGLFYLLEEYVVGENLLARLERQGNFNERQIRELALAILNSLQLLHQNNLIHGAIEPTNIIFRPLENFTEEIVLVNLQLSQELLKAIGLSSISPNFGYRAPEHQYSPTDDLFSLGATCFHLLTAINPQELWHKQGYSWVFNWQQYVKQPVSDLFEKILHKLIRLEKKERYQTVVEVLKALQPSSQDPDRPTVPLKKTTNQTTHSSLTAPIHRPLPKTILSSAPQPSNPPSPRAQKNSLLAIVVSLVGVSLIFVLIGNQIYQYFRYGVFPSNPLSAFSRGEQFFLQYDLIGHDRSLNALAIHPDGKTLISTSGDRTIKIWSLDTGNPIKTFLEHDNNLLTIQISPDGENLVGGGDDSQIEVWNVKTGKESAILNGHKDWINALVFSPNGEKLITASADRTLKIWDFKTGKVLHTLEGHGGIVVALAISPDGKIIASSSADKTIKIWDLATASLITTLSGYTNTVFALAIANDNKTLISGSGDGKIEIFDIENKTVINRISAHNSNVNAIAIAPNLKFFVSGGSDNNIKIWDLTTSNCLQILNKHTNAVRVLAVTPDSKTFVSGSADNTIKIWRQFNY